MSLTFIRPSGPYNHTKHCPRKVTPFLSFSWWGITFPFVWSLTRRDLVSLLKLYFLCHVQFLQCEISLVCHLKCLLSCFIVILGNLVLFMLIRYFHVPEFLQFTCKVQVFVGFFFLVFFFWFFCFLFTVWSSYTENSSRWQLLFSY